MKRSGAHICAFIMILAVVALGLSNQVGEASKNSDTPVTTTIDGIGVGCVHDSVIESLQDKSTFSR